MQPENNYDGWHAIDFVKSTTTGLATINAKKAPSMKVNDWKYSP